MGLPTPYFLFLGDAQHPAFAKTAFGLRDWAPEKCVGEWALPDAVVSTGLPKLSPVGSSREGARALVIGIANEGGYISQTWVPSLVAALEAGLDIITGMHARLADVPGLADVAIARAALIDVRVPPPDISGRHWPQARRQTAADGRHRLRAGQEIHRPCRRPRARGIAGSMPISARPGRPAS